MPVDKRTTKKIKKITPKYLKNVALWYLQRYASTEASLRRVLMRRIERSSKVHNIDRSQALVWVQSVVDECRRLGFIDDQRYAQLKTASLHRRGTSARMIRQKLAAKGVERETADIAFHNLTEENPHEELDLIAAMAYARRRRIGPYRLSEKRITFYKKDLAALGRAGFSYAIAKQVIESK